MKRLTKALLGVLTGTVALCSVAALTACEHTHEWATDYTVDKAATCTEDGSKSIHCNGCDETKDVTVIPAAHTWADDFTVDTPATCLGEGSKSVHCVNCDETKDVTVVAANGHDFEEEYTVDEEPTCTIKGSKSYHCKNCEVTDGATFVDALEHEPGEWIVEPQNLPALTAGGKATVYCTRTGCDALADEHDLPALTSEDYASEVVTPSTCTTAGSATYVYNKDGVVVTFTGGIALAPHQFGETLDLTDKTVGDIVGYKCGVCGAVDNDNSYVYINNSVIKNTDNPFAIDTDKYYFNIELEAEDYALFKLDLAMAGKYTITFNQLDTDNVAYLYLMCLDGKTDTTNMVASGRGTAATLQGAFKTNNVATITHNDTNKQVTEITFDSTNYVGQYLDIRLRFKTCKVTATVEFKSGYEINDGDTIKGLNIPCKSVSDSGVTSGGVTVLEVGDVEEGTYTLSFTVSNGLMNGSMLFFGKNIEPDYESIFGDTSKHGFDGTAEVIYQFPNLTVDNEDYTAVTAGRGKFTITLNLKKGDTLVFAHSCGTSGTIDISMNKV